MAEGPALTDNISRAVPGALRALVWPLAALALLVVLAVWFAIGASRHATLEREAARLEAVSELRAGQVQGWLQTRVNQARFAAATSIGELFQRWKEDNDPATRAHLAERLGSFQRASGNVSVMLVDPRGELVMDSPAGSGTTSPELRAAAADAVRSKAPQYTHFYGYGGPPPAPRLDVVAPFPFSGGAAGALVVRLDPNDQLFPLLARWPLPSRSAVTSLVRRDGDFIIGPRSQNRVPLATPNLLAARVLRGDAPKGKALLADDLRGSPVLGVVQAVPGTPWHLVSRIDRDEVYAEANRSALGISAAGMLALLAGGAGAYWLHGRRQLREARAAQAREAVDRQRLEDLVAQRTLELAARNQSLERTVGDLEAFSASVSHDLRGPLRTMSGFATLLERGEGASLSADGRRKLARIVAGAATMDRMIEDILRCSRAERVEMNFTTVDLNLLVQDVLHQLAPAYPAADVRVGALPVVQADATLAHQVFSNLVGNALKFSAHQAAPLVEIGAVDDPPGPALFVRDNGVGFDSAQAARLFAPFQRLHSESEYPGTGVGLSIVKRLLERHGGSISARSEPGRTEFVFSFGPVTPQPGTAHGPDRSA